VTQDASVRVTVYVAVDPETAFTVFTAEVDAWYKRGPNTFADPKEAVGMRFEPHVGGRFLEVHDAATGEGVEHGRIQVWEPGRRLVFTDRRGTEVEVRFEADAGQTRVTLEHRGLERLAPQVAAQVSKYGWRLLLPWFAQHLAGPDRQPYTNG
jgi:uncharacterized protein YndB with AHSA1/START domain